MLCPYMRAVRCPVLAYHSVLSTLCVRYAMPSGDTPVSSSIGDNAVVRLVRALSNCHGLKAALL
eukprot:3788219-Rhodomonas_salina.1